MQPWLTRRGRRRYKIAYIRWLLSPQGTQPVPYLRSFAPRRHTALRIWAAELLSGHLAVPRKIGRIYLPSPPCAKLCAIRWHARHYKPKYFIETGTFLGDTTAAVADLFEECLTVELSAELYGKACARFADAATIRCLHGDSGELIAKIVPDLSAPALFWLDAHASGGLTTHASYDPLLTELEAILAQRETGHVILIDDARGHPIERIRRMVPSGRSFAVRNDIIRILPA